MVCLDTSFLVALIRRDGVAEKRLEEYIASEARLTTTPITVCELFKGAYRSDKREKQVKIIKDMLRYLEVLEFSIDACQRYGKMVNELRNIGIPIGDLDAIIASIALTHNEAVVTKDIKHFERVPDLIVETW